MAKSTQDWIDEFKKFTGEKARPVKKSALANFFEAASDAKIEKILSSAKCQIVGTILVTGMLVNIMENADEVAKYEQSQKWENDIEYADYQISISQNKDENTDTKITPAIEKTKFLTEKYNDTKNLSKEDKKINDEGFYISKAPIKKAALANGVKEDIFDANWETFKKARKLLLPLNLYFENVSDTVYLDSGGTPTIAGGMTIYPSGKRVRMGDKNVSQTLSPELIKEHGSYSQATLAKMRYYTEYHDDVEVFAPLLKSLKRKISEKEMTVLGSLTSNRGIGRVLRSEMMKKINTGKDYKKNLLTFNYDKNRTWQKGLQIRRAIEYLILNDKIDLSQIMNFPIAGGYGDVNFAVLYDVRKVNKRAGAVNVPRTDNATINKFLHRQKLNLPKVKDKIDNKTVKHLQNYLVASR